MVLNLLYRWVKLTDEQEKKIASLEEQAPSFIKVEDHNILVVKIDNKIYAINNVCPHAGASLHPGWCNKKGIITCPLHQYKFDVKTGISTDGNGYHIKTFKLLEKEGHLHIGIKRF